MGDLTNLVTTCTFKGREFVVKMNVPNGNLLEVSATDKFSAEEWSCCFDPPYIENLTRRTGNFKQFEVFNTMLKSGLLKSSDCVNVELLNFDDLELLRNTRYMGRSTENTSRPSSSHNLLPNLNRRYLILSYIVEFDRVHYPLPLEYCGPPDPQILQSIIRRLEAESSKLREQLAATSCNVPSNDKIKFLENKVEELTFENRKLTSEVQSINRTRLKLVSSERRAEELEKQLHTAEETWSIERRENKRLVGKLREEKAALLRRLNLLEGSARVGSYRKSEETECARTKSSSIKIAPEKARVEKMRTGSRKYLSETSNQVKLSSRCRSDDSLAAARIPHGIRSRSCSASSRGSKKRSHARACCSSPVTDVTCKRDTEPRGRSRTRRNSSASSNASATFKGQRSRNGSASSCASIHSYQSARSNSGAETSKKANGRHGKAKMKTMNDLELRIKKLQKLLDGNTT